MSGVRRCALMSHRHRLPIVILAALLALTWLVDVAHAAFLAAGMLCGGRAPTRAEASRRPYRHAGARVSTTARLASDLAEDEETLQPLLPQWPLEQLPRARFQIFQAVLMPDEVEQTLAAARSLAAAYDQDADSVDGKPSFELELIRAGCWLSGMEPLRAALERPLGDLVGRIRVWHDARYRDENFSRLIVSQVLVRRYLVGERRSHPVHYDDHAMVTGVCSLTPPRENSGLFVQYNATRASREFVGLPAPGDFVVHGPDLAHGVKVLGDEERFSLVVWLLPEDDVSSGSVAWSDRLAAVGDPHAQYRIGFRLEQRGEDSMAEMWFAKAAQQGHCPSMHHLGLLLQRRGKDSVALPWLWAASQLEYAPAQAELGDVLSGGGPPGQPPAPDSKAARLYEAAASQGHPMGQHRLARVLLWAGEEQAGEALLQAAATQGFAEAQADIGRLLRLRGLHEQATD